MRRSPIQLTIWRGLAASLVLVFVLLAVGCDDGGAAFSGRQAMNHLRTQVGFGPRPVGSEANRRTSDYIAQVLERNGWQVEFQEFTQGGLPIRNVIATKGTGPLILLGTHFDTRPVADRDPVDRSQPILGANDGASGTAVLLELSRVISPKVTDRYQIMLAFFDAEDRGNLNDWPFSVGAEYMAAHLEIAPRMVIVVDMVGDAQQEIYYEWNSSLVLMEHIWHIADTLGYSQWFIPRYNHAVIDDHIPFVRRGYPSVLIIDFDYTYWHTTQDTLERVSADSLQRVGIVLQTLLEGEPFASNPAAQ